MVGSRRLQRVVILEVKEIKFTSCVFPFHISPLSSAPSLYYTFTPLARPSSSSSFLFLLSFCIFFFFFSSFIPLKRKKKKKYLHGLIKSADSWVRGCRLLLSTVKRLGIAEFQVHAPEQLTRPCLGRGKPLKQRADARQRDGVQLYSLGMDGIEPGHRR
jgi:hypothetical protein